MDNINDKSPVHLIKNAIGVVTESISTLSINDYESSLSDTLVDIVGLLTSALHSTNQLQRNYLKSNTDLKSSHDTLLDLKNVARKQQKTLLALRSKPSTNDIGINTEWYEKEKEQKDIEVVKNDIVDDALHIENERLEVELKNTNSELQQLHTAQIESQELITTLRKLLHQKETDYEECKQNCNRLEVSKTRLKAILRRTNDVVTAQEELIDNLKTGKNINRHRHYGVNDDSRSDSGRDHEYDDDEEDYEEDHEDENYGNNMNDEIHDDEEDDENYDEDSIERYNYEDKDIALKVDVNTSNQGEYKEGIVIIPRVSPTNTKVLRPPLSPTPQINNFVT